LRRIPLVVMCALFLANSGLATAQIPIPHKKKPVNKSTEATNAAEPDKLLYDKAQDDIKHGKHEVGRLGLQTLINTYPDSEYLAKAKLAIADSYYKEGGTANTTQAIAGYKDFIVFFPFLPEAAYAQMQVAMANYNEMAKPDRDNSHAKAAEEELQTFLQKYPKDPLAPQAEQRLREVQEVIADGQFRIAYYYYLKGDRRAAGGRLNPLVRRYPLYSKADEALWMLGDLFEKSERKDYASYYYGQIVRNYPLSSHAADAKAKLVAFKVPVPQPDPKALALMTKEANTPRPKESLPHRALQMMHPGPDVDSAYHSGMPNLEPETDSPGTDVLSGAAVGRTSLVGGPSSGGSGSGPASGGPGSSGSSVVETVKPGDPTPPGGAASSGSAENVDSTPASDGAGASDAAAAATPDSSTAGSATDSSSTAAPASDATKTDGTQPATDSSNQKESSSKKKGIKKLIPW
jgi:outer membrane protein assembly factor BamD